MKEWDDTDDAENENKDGSKEIIASAMTPLEDIDSDVEYEALAKSGNNRTKKNFPGEKASM